jgi:anti-anti-sigma factor
MAPTPGLHPERCTPGPILSRGGALRPQLPFETRVEEHDGVAILALSGELDLATVPILKEDLAPFEGNGVSTIVLDLRDLTFIDSSGLLAFLEARRRAMSNGHRLVMSGASPAAQRLFELTGTQFLLDEQVIPDSMVRFFRDWVRRIDLAVE